MSLHDIFASVTGNESLEGAVEEQIEATVEAVVEAQVAAEIAEAAEVEFHFYLRKFSCCAGPPRPA